MSQLGPLYSVDWLNADDIRKRYNDWDFTEEGRIRQSLRMRELADASSADIVVADFVAPLEVMRDNFDAHIVIWVDTITESRFDDTNKAFVKPTKFNIRVTEQDTNKWGKIAVKAIFKNIGYA